MELLKVEFETLNQKFEDFKADTKQEFGKIQGKLETLIDLTQDGKLKYELVKRDQDELRKDFNEYKQENRKELNEVKDKRKMSAWLWAAGGIGFTVLGGVLTYLVIFVIEHS